MRISLDNLKNVAEEILKKVDVDVNSIDIIVDTILFANRRGNATHGIGRLPLYVNKIKNGTLNPYDQTEVIIDNECIAVMDAHNGFGQVAAYHAAKMGIDRANRFGVSVVGVRNSNNFGTAGYFGNLIASQGYMALIFSNAAPALAPTGGSKKIFGTNPICFAFPGTKEKNPIILDMATTVAARGKIRLAAKNGEKIPMDWATDKDGNPTDDPEKALMGMLLPIAGYKGYGLSMFVDIFAGLITGSAFAGDVKNLGNIEAESRMGHFLIIIDPKKMMPEEEIDERINKLYQNVKLCGENVFMPGEIEYNELYNNSEYVEISNKQFEDINTLAENINVNGRLINVE